MKNYSKHQIIVMLQHGLINIWNAYTCIYENRIIIKLIIYIDRHLMIFLIIKQRIMKMIIILNYLLKITYLIL